jgi:hypothetical protein
MQLELESLAQIGGTSHYTAGEQSEIRLADQHVQLAESRSRSTALCCDCYCKRRGTNPSLPLIPFESHRALLWLRHVLNVFAVRLPRRNTCSSTPGM